MVAEAIEAPAKPSVRRKNTPKGKMVGRIDLLTRSQARNLYVVRQLSAPEVATQTGLTPSQIYNLADREGWTKTRAEIKRKSAEALRARDEEDIGEIVEAVAVKSQVLSLGTLDSAITELATPGEFQAKNLQALSVAAKNFVGLYRQAKSLDVAAQQGNTTNVLFISCARVGVDDAASKSEPKRVEPSAAPIDAKVTQLAPEA